MSGALGITAVTGVAGSGKSSLLRYAFLEQHPDAIVIDQKPIGTSIRSTPATYTGVMDEIRKLFAKSNGVGAGWFSFILACKKICLRQRRECIHGPHQTFA